MKRALLGLLGLALLWAAPGFAKDTVYYYYTDSLRSATVETDAQGKVIERTYYAPYGQVLNRAMRDGPGYTGHEEDPGTGLVYMQQRYYDPESGRFLSTDPMQADGDGGSFNRYEYAKDNPYRYIDPSGMNACGNSDDSRCKVTVTFQDRTRNAKGQYNDQFAGLKGNGAYNATANVTVNGKKAGTFLASTVPSSSKYATLRNGTYTGTYGVHDGHAAIRINGGGRVSVVGGPDPATGKPYATGILVHIAGIPTRGHPLGGTGMTSNHRPISAGCQLVCSIQYHKFEQASGLLSPNASPPQRHFTVIVDTAENQ